jgi:hypothetical protein
MIMNVTGNVLKYFKMNVSKLSYPNEIGGTAQPLTSS